jgi:hypothetical protein
MRIEGSERPLPASGKSAVRKPGANFTVAEPLEEAGAEAAEAAEAAAPLAVIGTLTPPDDTGDVTDREAAQQGAALLDAMAGLQQALIDGDPRVARARLAGLAQQTLSAADPRLDQLLQAVAQRAAVELARSEGA